MLIYGCKKLPHATTCGGWPANIAGPAEQVLVRRTHYSMIFHFLSSFSSSLTTHSPVYGDLKLILLKKD